MMLKYFSSTMKITRIVHQAASMRSSIRNAYINFEEMTGSIVAVVSNVVRKGKVVIGFGFSSNGRYEQGGILNSRMIPRLLAAEPDSYRDERTGGIDPFKAWDIMMTNEKPGGHGERSVAVGVIDMALWDLVAKLEEKPLYQLLAERFNSGRFDESVRIYAAGGYYYPGKELDGLRDEMRRYLETGYDSVKMKVGGVSLQDDLRRIEAVIEAVGDPSRVAVDANGRFDLETALAFGRAIEPLGLMWYEEAGDPLDYALQAELSKSLRTPMATGENLFSHQDVRNLARHAGMNPEVDFLQMDPALAYGLVEYLRMLEVLKPFGWTPRRCIPHGGHQFALHLAAGLQLYGNESYPGVFQPFGGFGDGIPVENGRIAPPKVPGIGIELKNDLYRIFRDLTD